MTDYEPNRPSIENPLPVPPRRGPDAVIWVWLTALAGVVILAGVLFGVTRQRQEAGNPPAVVASPGPAAGVPAPKPQTTTGQAAAPAAPTTTGQGSSKPQ
jgi:hypothetical protein